MNHTNHEFHKSLLMTAKIHIDRLNYAMEKLQRKYPLTGEIVAATTDEELLLWELLTSRFAKLQDFMGNKIFNAYLNVVGENIDSWTMIDKINKLEKLGIITSADFWINMRLLRNHLAHEYPEHPEITAKYLNQTIEAVPQLLDCLNKILLKFE